MKRIKFFLSILVIVLLSIAKSYGATSFLPVGQTYQTEISSSGYHYITIESVSSSNPSVAVSKMGLVVKATVNAYFHGESTVTIIIKYQLYPGQSYQYSEKTVTIACTDTAISISPTSENMKNGETLQLTYGFDKPTYITPSITWSSSNDAVATVSSSGLVTANSEGEATIYAKSNLGSNVASCKINVSSQSKPNPGGTKPFSADVSWYNEEDSEFEISTPSQLLGFRNLVEQGHHFKNKTVKLANDIDVSTYNWTNPISNYPNVFEGIFDGVGHSLTIYIDTEVSSTQEYLYFGFFGNCWGLIRNLTLKGSVEVDIAGKTTYAYVGALCGISSKMESCINEATLTFSRSYLNPGGNSDRIGGLAGSCTRTTTNCINKGTVFVKTQYSSNNTNNYYIGGITGFCSDITACVNYGLIKNETAGDSNYYMLREYIGGITGWCLKSKVLRCSNFGDIIGNSEYSGVGGIIGGSGGNITCTNSYVGKCSIGNYQGGSTVYVNTICGCLQYHNETFDNNYSANDITMTNRNRGESGCIEYSSNQMQTKSFASTLSSVYWIGVDGKYPVVKGSLEESLYYITDVENITCTSAVLNSNILDVLYINDVKTCGFLITKDDGKESYNRCKPSECSLTLHDLSPNRTYSVRWYAQDKTGKEYYGVKTQFTTHRINPEILSVSNLSVSSCSLSANIFYDEYTKLGFYIHEAGIEDGFYIWDVNIDGNTFSTSAVNLKGDTEYEYCAIADVNGIFYESKSSTFKTLSICTLAPTDFTNQSVKLNGELGIQVENAYFEYRASSTPSVIESSKIPCVISKGKAYATLTDIIMNETYRYRLVAISETEEFYGDWIDFVFEGITGVTDSAVDLRSIIKVYNLNGIEQPSDLKSLPRGIYIIQEAHSTRKIMIR